mmetsp:Transcript_22367/g.43523  ORF Transcript_22367/g.43523 Transcript_22367/m.43523 type:complete len:260 (+) Transcript_22367:202-981(+)
MSTCSFADDGQSGSASSGGGLSFDTFLSTFSGVRILSRFSLIGRINSGGEYSWSSLCNPSNTSRPFAVPCLSCSFPGVTVRSITSLLYWFSLFLQPRDGSSDSSTALCGGFALGVVMIALAIDVSDILRQRAPCSICEAGTKSERKLLLMFFGANDWPPGECCVGMGDIRAGLQPEDELECSCAYTPAWTFSLGIFKALWSFSDGIGGVRALEELVLWGVKGVWSPGVLWGSNRYGSSTSSAYASGPSIRMRSSSLITV